ncbi:MAG: insulinase family protein [Planctomycetota bacterium]|nr:insulinase family protein [Planctomycetota bacterium]
MLAAITVVGLALNVSAGVGGNLQPYSYREFRLNNGLRVLTMEDFSSPLVAVASMYHAGWNHEPRDRTDLAHLLEHVLFRGSEHPMRDEALRLPLGGTSTGATNYECTRYMTELPANQLDLALWLEAERMAFPRISQRSLDTCRSQVLEEWVPFEGTTLTYSPLQPDLFGADCYRNSASSVFPNAV